MNGDSVKNEDNSYIVKVRGLPYSATAHDVAFFFSGCDIKGGKSEGVKFCFNSQTGKPSGECFVEFLTAPDLRKALLQHHRYLGRRYLEVEKTTEDAMEAALKTQGEAIRTGCPIVRLRGLPFRTTDEEIEKLFSGLSIDKVVIVKDMRGQAAGDGYVQFEKEGDMKEALDRHMEKIGHRYIEVFQAYNISDLDDMPKSRPQKSPPKNNYITDQQQGYAMYDVPGDWHRRNNMRGGAGAEMGGGGGGLYHTVRMRGLPFQTTEQEIAEFFEPVCPVHISLIYSRNGRPSGEAEVSFGSYQDATAAMQKDKQYLGSRYVELFQEPMPQSGGYMPRFSGGVRGGRGSVPPARRYYNNGYGER